MPRSFLDKFLEKRQYSPEEQIIPSRQGLRDIMERGIVEGLPRMTQPKRESDFQKFQEMMDILKTEEDEKAASTLTRQPSAVPPSPKLPTEIPPSSEEIPIEEGPSILDQLREAQKASSLARLTARLGQASELIGTAIAGTKPVAQELFEKQAQEADQIVQNLKERIQMEKFDPTSQTSKNFRIFLNKFGVQFDKSISASDAEKLMPFAVRHFEAEEERKARQELQKERLRATKELKVEAALAKQAANKREAELDKEKDDDKWIAKTSALLAKSKQATELSKVRGARNFAEKIYPKSPTAVNDITHLYNLIRALDPGSVVREGEIALAQRAIGFWDTIMLKLSKVSSNPRLLDDKTVRDIKNTIKQLTEVGESEYNLLAQPFQNQAKRRFKDNWEERWTEVGALTSGPLSRQEQKELEALEALEKTK